MTTTFFRSRKAFQIWFGVGAPLFFLGSVYLAAQLHLMLGATVFFLLVIRVWDSFRTTCRRCGFYGSWKCGLPGKFVPLFYEREHSSLPKNRIHTHYLVDLMATAMALGLYGLHGGMILVLGLVWPLGALFIVFAPKRYHGLLPHLKNEFQV